MRSFPKMLRGLPNAQKRIKMRLKVHLRTHRLLRFRNNCKAIGWTRTSWKLWGERLCMWGVGFTNKSHWKKHFDIRPLKLYILKLNWSFGGLGDSLDSYKNGFFQFGHPHIINVNGRVLFCRDCWEEDGVCRGWDFGEAGVVTVQCKGKQSSALVYSRVPRVGWEAGGCSCSHISVEENSFWCALWCHFWCDRADRARPFWCAVTRKYGGAARGSQRAKQRCDPEPLGQQDAVLYLVLTYIEEVRKTFIVMPPQPRFLVRRFAWSS